MLLWPERWRAARLFVLAGLILFFSTLPPYLPGWPKTASRWHPLAWDSTAFESVVGIDFFAIYEAGVFLREGLDPYMVDGALIHDVGGPRKAPYVATFRYLPITLFWISAPLSWMPPWRALQVWTLILIALVFYGVGATAALAGRWRSGEYGARAWWTEVAAAALWFAYFPLMVEMHMGQFSFFMAMLMFYFALPWALPRTDGKGDDAIPVWRVAPWAFSVWLKNFSALFWPWWLGAWFRYRGTPQGRRAASGLLLATLTGVILVASTFFYFKALAPGQERGVENSTIAQANTDGAVSSEDGALQRFRDKATDSRLLGSAPYHLYWGRQGFGLGVALTDALPELKALPLELETIKMDDALYAMDPNPISKPMTLALSIALAVWAAGAAFMAGRSGRGALEAFALVWLWWFFTYVDCWEHHYTMLLPLLALLAFGRRLPPLLAVAVFLCWGTPSLWGTMVESYDALSAYPTLRAVLLWVYFIQRPIGVFLVTAWMTRRLAAIQPRSSGNAPPRTAATRA